MSVRAFITDVNRDGFREVAEAIRTAGGKDAKDVNYDNTTSGLEADNVQDAIDEVAGDVSEIAGDVSDLGTAVGGLSDDVDNLETAVGGISDDVDNLEMAVAGKIDSAGVGLLKNGTTISTYVPRVIQDANTKPGQYTFNILEYDNQSTNLPTNNFYHILTTEGHDTPYAVQLALGMTTEKVFYRICAGDSWHSWKELTLGLKRKTVVVSTDANGYIKFSDVGLGSVSTEKIFSVLVTDGYRDGFVSIDYQNDSWVFVIRGVNSNGTLGKIGNWTVRLSIIWEE